MTCYTYSGPVMSGFNKCIANKWQGTTYAPSKQKAKSNLAYQFKKANNLLPNVKITLPGDVKEVG